MKVKNIVLSLVLTSGLLQGCSTASSQSKDLASPSVSENGHLKVSYLDVGQGDSTLIVFPEGKTILIDAGDNEHGDAVVKDLKKAGVKQIDYMITTHPDLDHIGGCDNVIYNVPVKNVVMPKKSHNTKAFENLLDAIKAKNIPVTEGKKGLSLDVGSKASATVLSPDPQFRYEDNNDFSVVLKVNYGKESFLYVGDSSKKVEANMIKAGEDLTSTVLKTGHHGSKSSSSPAFLKAVKPEVAVISVGKDNKYKHPNIETLQRLHKSGVSKIFRTDDSGTITVETDGNTLNWSTEK